MKFKTGDKVLVTAGKDKGTKSEITRVLAKSDEVVVKGANMYTRHVKPIQGRAGEMVRLERPMSTAKIAVLNDKGQPDRIAVRVSKDGLKERVFAKSGGLVPESGKTKKKK